MTAPNRQFRRLDADEVRRAAAGRWHGILTRLGVPPDALRNRHGPCPGCGGHDRFRFDDQGAGRWICGGGGAPTSGDGFALLEHVHGWTFPESLRTVAGVLGMDDSSSPQAPPPRREPPPAAAGRPEKRQTLSTAYRRIWRNSRAITEDCPAGRYLLGRGCALPPEGGDLRWHPRLQVSSARHDGPVMLGLITDPHDPSIWRSLHMTLLTPAGRKADVRGPAKRYTKGHTSQGVCRIWPDEDVTLGLLVGEGVESALTAAHGFTPVWATLDAANLTKLPVLGGIESLTIVADHDDAGLRAAETCARRWTEADKQVRVWTAAQPGADPNDYWGASDEAA